MAKGQTVTAGVLVMAGMLLRPSALLAPRGAPGEAVQQAEQLAQPGLEVSGEGPWIASCKYWAPVRQELPSKRTGTKLSVHIEASPKSFKEHETSAEASEQVCKGSSDPWGIPAEKIVPKKKPAPKSSEKKRPVAEKPGEAPRVENHLKPDITAIIAAVPTPVHSRLALQFDRTLDAILEAAADNDYVQSYYWLPWMNAGESAKQESGGDATNESERKERERQPGLIILKQVPPRPLAESDCKLRANAPTAFCRVLDDAYYHVVYLFLVGNTPVEGMDGYQLNRAFRYERALQNLPGLSVRFSMKQAGEVDIIGSEASGSAASMREAIAHALPTGTREADVHIAGGTSTDLATAIYSSGDEHPDYVSFGDNSHYEVDRFLKRSAVSHSMAFLIEDGTAYASALTEYAAPTDFYSIKILRYPLGISTLRNAQLDEHGTTQPESVPTPFLPFSWRDTAPQDSVPHFPTRQLPLSQQAQLDEISHQLNRNRIELVVIQGSNVLDEIFLANFLHRTVPDARLVSVGGGDLLEEHEVSNLPLIGSITIAPYTLITPSTTYNTNLMRAFSDRNSESTYNAASFTFWHDRKVPRLTNYADFFDSSKPIHPSLWATVIGRDGFYPVDVLDDCASDSPKILPSFVIQQGTATRVRCSPTANAPLDRANRFVGAVPLSWFVCCTIVSLLCIMRSVVLQRANFWMPSIRDLAIDYNDEPHRRALYINIGTIMLCCMTFALSYPLYPVSRLINTGTNSIITAFITIASGVVVLICTGLKTYRYVGPYKACKAPKRNECSGCPNHDDPAFCIVFQIVAILTLLVFIGLWIRYCGLRPEVKEYNRLFFAYRCLHLTSGVSPLAPILLLLAGWYTWSMVQTRRLRFTLRTKPALPSRINDVGSDLLFVSDKDLEASVIPGEVSLYTAITSLLITRELVRRTSARARSIAVDICVVLGYLALLVTCLWLAPIQGIENLFSTDIFPYGRLVEILFLPLLIIALSGWVRTLVTWNALNRSLLWRLEECPIRRAFSRMKNVGWILMMRQNGMVQRWREMARSTESMRQLLHLAQIRDAIDRPPGKMCKAPSPADYPAYLNLTTHISEIMLLVGCESIEMQKALPSDLAGSSPPVRKTWTADAAQIMREKLLASIEQNRNDRPALQQLAQGGDIPEAKNCLELLLMYLVENDYAEFATVLLKRVLIPYWQHEKTGFVESEPSETPGSSKKTDNSREVSKTEQDSAEPAEDVPTYIQLAEEFVAIRYVSLIRAVLVNIRHLMTFVSLSFVFAIVSWNSYPFRPREWADAALTGILIVTGGGIIWVFAQMHRDPILSRLTGTKANELGSEFYFRVISYCTLPVLTWLAYQFPAISNEILKYFQPEVAAK